MNDAWQSAISLAESVAAGDAEVSELQGAMRRLATDPDLLRGGSVGRDLAYLTHLCGSVGRPDLSGELMQRMAEEVRDPHGEESARAALLALAVHSAPRWPYFLAGLPTALSILAILGLPEGDDEGAARHASSALALPPSAEVPEEDRLDVELSTVSILAEEARRDHRVQEADSLLDELETLARRVVELRGEDHPKSWSALVALASAEFGAAVSAGDRDRMERAIDVLALAAQKTAATLGASHLRALATLRAFAGAEYEAAALLGPERRLADARAMVESVAARSGDRQEGTESADAPAPGGRPLRRYSVLGPVRAWHGEEPLQIGTPQQRALLAILLLHGDHSATADRLIDGIWGQDPPASAQAAVRTYAFRLRKSLGDDTLVHEAGRYTLRIRDNELDLTLAEKLASDAEAAVAEGDAERARDLYAAALQGFVGEPLAGLPGPFAAQHRERLYRWRQTLLERRLELDLATGRLDEAVAELTALTAADPRSDRLRELLLRAQHRSRTER